MSTPLRSRRAPCAIHGLAVADDGLCVRCRRQDGEDRGAGVGWPALFALGCCAAGLIGWQAAKMGPEALSLRPQHHLAVISLEATSPVERLRAEQIGSSRERRLVRPEPIQPAYAPEAVEVTLSAEEQRALEAPPPAPVLYGGVVDAPEAAPTKIVVKVAPSPQDVYMPVYRGRGPDDALGGGRPPHRRAVPNRPVLLPPPGGSFPGGGTGELWGSRTPTSGARSAPRANRRAARPTPRRPSAARPAMRSAGRMTGARSRASRAPSRR